MDDKLIELINEKTPIVDLVSEYVSLQKKGKNFAGLCPFHQEKTPSFFVSPEKNFCKCYGCGEGGTPINFLRKIKNISFEEAALELADRAGIEVKDRKVKKELYEKEYALMQEVANFYEFNLTHSEKGSEAIRYLYNRQMSDEAIKHFRLGYAPSFGSSVYQLLKNKGYQVSDMIKLGVVKQNDQGEYYDLFADRIMFPITDPKGHVVGFSGRTMNKDETVKYMNSPETLIFKKGRLLYHLYEALQDIRKEKQVVLYEGFFDVISSYGAGIRHGIATMGTSLTKEQARLIKSVSPSVLVAYDGDQAGLSAADHAIPIMDQEGLKVEVLTIPEKMDPDDFITSYGPEAYEKLFGEYTEDSFQFRYRYYRMGKNLTNANDLKSYIQQVRNMVQSVDPSIRAFYYNRLATEFQIPIEELGIKPLPKKIEPIKIPAKERPKTTNKYEMAERYLIMAMMQDRAWSELIMSKLRSNDFADPILASIRIQIEHLYEDHEKLTPEEILSSLTSDQREVMEKSILKDAIWKKGKPVEEKDVLEDIETLYEASDKRRLDELNQRLQQEYDPVLAKERDALKIRLVDKTKED